MKGSGTIVLEQHETMVYAIPVAIGTSGRNSKILFSSSTLTTPTLHNIHPNKVALQLTVKKTISNEFSHYMKDPTTEVRADEGQPSVDFIRMHEDIQEK